MGKANNKDKRKKSAGARVSNSSAAGAAGAESSGIGKRRMKRKPKRMNRSSSTSSLESNGASVEVDKGGETKHHHNVREPKCTLDDLKGIDGVKKTLLEEIIWPFANPDKARALKAEIHKGILLTGMPGTGKTCLADGIVSEIVKEGRDVRYYEETGALLDCYLGESEKKLRNLFQTAAETAPSVIFFDELDGLGGKRGETSANSTMNTIVTTFLTEMNKIENGKVLIIAATNHPELCDQALIRPGRFDIRLDLPLPDLDGRIAIVEHYLEKKGVSVGAKELKKVCREIRDFSGSDLKTLVERSWASFLNRIFPGGVWRNMSVEDLAERLQPGLFDIELDVKIVLERMTNAKVLSGSAEVKSEPMDVEVIEISDDDNLVIGPHVVEELTELPLNDTSNDTEQGAAPIQDLEKKISGLKLFGEYNQLQCRECGLLFDKGNLTLQIAHSKTCQKKLQEVKDEDGNTFLHLAVLSNDEDDVEELIRNGADIDSHANAGLTPLHFAARNLCRRGGDAPFKIIKTLLNYNAEVSFGVDGGGLTFLHMLCFPNSKVTPSQFHSLVEFLVKNDLSETFEARYFFNGMTPLLLAVQHVDVEEKTLLLLHASGVDFTVTDNNGATVFHYAVQKVSGNLPELFANFIKLGANYKFVDNEKRTLLHLVAEYGNLDALKFVLTLDLDINQENAKGETPLSYAQRCCRKNLAEVSQLLTEGAKPNEFLKEQEIVDKTVNSVSLENTSRAKFKLRCRVCHQIFDQTIPRQLIAHSKTCKKRLEEVKDEHGNTFLHLAVKSNDEDDVEELLRIGADVDSQNDVGVTPLHRAAYNLSVGNGGDIAFKIIKSLFACRANVNICNEMKFTFLHTLCGTETKVTPSQFHTVVALLVKHGLSEAFTVRCFINGMTPLHGIIYSVDVEEKTLLLLHNRGIDFAVTDALGATVFHYAIWGSRSNQPELFANFIKFGANYKFVDRERRTLLHLVAQFGNLDTLKFVLTLGLDINQANAQGETPLRYAKRCGRMNLAKVSQLLIEKGATAMLKDKIEVAPLTKEEKQLENLCAPEKNGVKVIIPVDLSR